MVHGSVACGTRELVVDENSLFITVRVELWARNELLARNTAKKMSVCSPAQREMRQRERVSE